MSAQAKFSIKPNSGFTLIELLIAITIASIIMAISFVSFSTIQKSARDTQRKNDLQTVAGALQRFYNDYGEYLEDSSNKFEYWATSCIAGSGGVGTNIIADWGVGVISCNNKNYIKQLPKEPLSGNPQYCYFADQISGKLNQRYELYANLEKSTGTTYTPSTCNLGAGQSYNYRITSRD